MDRTADRPWVIGHRGASAARRENPVVAFRHAYALGANKVETVVHSGNPAVVIVDHIDESMSPSDAVVMGRRGLGDLGGLLLGSVSHRVAQDATCAVITVQ